MADVDDSIEIRAYFEQNYRAHPDDPFIMARAACGLSQRFYPKCGGSPEAVYNDLLSKCKAMVGSAIEAAQAAWKDEAPFE